MQRWTAVVGVWIILGAGLAAISGSPAPAAAEEQPSQGMQSQQADAQVSDSNSSQEHEPGRPDLVISGIRLADDPVPGRNISFYVAVTNVGSAAASQFVVDIAVDGHTVAKQYLGGLGAGQTVEFTTEPPWRGEAGVHEVVAVADREHSVAESEEGNNKGSRTFELSTDPRPDMAVTHLGVQPRSPLEGDRVIFNVTVTNQGQAPARNISFRLDVYDDHDRPVWSNFEVLREVAPGRSIALSPGTWNATPGNHTVLATVGFAANETRDDNNRAILPVYVKSQPDPYQPRPDLAVTNLGVHPASPRAGDEVMFNVTVTNRGDAWARNVSLRLDVDGLDESAWSNFEVFREVAPGESIVVMPCCWTATSGDHTVLATVGFAANETRDDNNRALASFHVAVPDPEPRPDLRVRWLTLTPERPVEGERVNVRVGIENVGDVLAPSSVVEVRFDNETIALQEVGEVEPGQTIRGMFEWTADAPGNHTMTAYADVRGEVDEASEHNNHRATHFVVEPQPDNWVLRTRDSDDGNDFCTDVKLTDVTTACVDRGLLASPDELLPRGTVLNASAIGLSVEVYDEYDSDMVCVKATMHSVGYPWACVARSTLGGPDERLPRTTVAPPEEVEVVRISSHDGEGPYGWCYDTYVLGLWMGRGCSSGGDGIPRGDVTVAARFPDL